VTGLRCLDWLSEGFHTSTNSTVSVEELKAQLNSAQDGVRMETASLVDHGSAIDDHHSPVKPEAYIKTRMFPAKPFYQDRLPLYTRLRTET
jgi:hypothetical protein